MHAPRLGWSSYCKRMRLRHAPLQVRNAAVRLVSFAALSVPLACAVATEPELKDYEGGGAAGLADTKAGSPPTSGTAGSPSNAFGGTGSMPSGGTAHAGASAAAGKGGMVSGGGKPSGGGGQSSAGANHGAGAGGASGGTGGAPSNGCSALKAWKGGDSTLTIAAGEVVQWMGKRYKATAAIAYPNAECVPDMPAAWCAEWFTPDGDC